MVQTLHHSCENSSWWDPRKRAWLLSIHLWTFLRGREWQGRVHIQRQPHCRGLLDSEVLLNLQTLFASQSVVRICRGYAMPGHFFFKGLEKTSRGKGSFMLLQYYLITYSQKLVYFQSRRTWPQVLILFNGKWLLLVVLSYGELRPEVSANPAGWILHGEPLRTGLLGKCLWVI